MTDIALTPPENGITKSFRRIAPGVMVLDILTVAMIAVKFFMVLFVPSTSSVIEGSQIVLFEVVPAVSVVLTAIMAASLITSRLSSLEVDRAQLATVKDKDAKSERATYLNEQIAICGSQRRQSWLLMVGYILIAGTPHIFNMDITSILGKSVFLFITAGEISIPVLNMRTFSIVEATMHALDSVGNAIHASNAAVMLSLKGIAERAGHGALSRSDRQQLRAARGGNIDKALESREPHLPEPLAGAMYISLRQRVTGTQDGQPLDNDQARRYARAMDIARKYRAEGSPWLPHFRRGQHGALQVDSEVGDMILRDLGQVRIRPARVKQPVTS